MLGCRTAPVFDSNSRLIDNKKPADFCGLFVICRNVGMLEPTPFSLLISKNLQEGLCLLRKAPNFTGVISANAGIHRVSAPAETVFVVLGKRKPVKSSRLWLASGFPRPRE